MKKIILIMAVVVMAMVSSPVFGDDFEDWYSGRTKWDGTPRYHHSHNSNRGYGHRRGGHGGVAAIKSQVIKMATKGIWSSMEMEGLPLSVAMAK